MPGKAVVIAFDGAEPSLINRGIEEGWMPTMQHLASSGRFTALRGLQDLLVSSTWPTTVIGREVHEHHLVGDKAIAPGTYTYVDLAAEASRKPPFWAYASAGGLKTTACSIYGAPLLRDFNGVQITGWGTLDPFATKGRPPMCNIPGVLEKVDAHVGGRKGLSSQMPIPRTEKQYVDLQRMLLASIRQQTEGLRYLMRNTDWDLFIGSISEGHHGGHFMWHFMDPAHEDHRADADRTLLNGVPDLYRQIDAGIGSLLQEVPADVPFYVFCPYGFERNAHATDFAEDILVRAGLLARRTSADVAILDRRLRALKMGRTVVRKLVPGVLRPSLGRLVPRDRWLGELALADVDWDHTQAFVLPSDISTGIRINLKGREPEGAVEPGPEYDAVCDRVIEIMGTVTDPRTGEPAVLRSDRVDRLFGITVEGPLPDVVIAWRQGRRFDELSHPDFGSISIAHSDPRSAIHTPMGFVIGAGVGIAPGGRGVLEGGATDLLDFAPTILAAIGADHDLPGTAIKEIVPR